MKGFVYSATEDGNLVHKKTGNMIEIEKFSLEPGKRGQVIKIEKKGGGIKSVLRHQVDETAFSFGPDPKGGKGAEAAPIQSREKSPCTIMMTKEELLEIHKSLQSAADLTLKKIVEAVTA
jgi:hypothetical protein